MQRVEVVVSSVSAAFDEHMKRFAEKNHLAYTPLPPMMELIRFTIIDIPSTTTLTAAAGELEVLVPDLPVRLGIPMMTPHYIVTLDVPMMFDTYQDAILC